MYGYYALEKACIFANVETVGSRKWYESGARVLLRDQLANGGWGKGRMMFGGSAAGDGEETDLISTSFALLFLLRRFLRRNRG